MLFDHSLLLKTCPWSMPVAVICGFKVSSFPKRKSEATLVLLQDTQRRSTLEHTERPGLALALQWEKWGTCSRADW